MYPGGMGAGTGTGAQARLAAKQAELEGLRALRDQSARLAREMARLGERVDVLVDGGDGESTPLPRTACDEMRAATDPTVCSRGQRSYLLARRVPRHPDRPMYVPFTPPPARTCRQLTPCLSAVTASVASTQAQAHNEEQDETNDTDPDADQDQDAQAPKLTQHVDLDRIVRVPVGLDPALLDHDS